MLVFDDSGNSYYIDVVLMGYSSEMVPMDEFLDRAAKRGDRQAVDRLLDDFCHVGGLVVNDGSCMARSVRAMCWSLPMERCT